jgi:hypothetical protein
MANVHCAAALSSFVALESHWLDLPFWRGLATGLDEPLIQDGYVTVPDRPGLGVDLDLEGVAANLRWPGLFEPTPEWDRPSWAFGSPTAAGIASRPSAPVRRCPMDVRHKPAYHYAPPRNWINDPNGMIHWQGVYHLFYQYAPFSAGNGVKHWGHAVSADLTHWSQRPIALSPTPGGPDKDGVWSGCAIDWDGLPLAFYTGVFPEQQCLAVGDDSLERWVKYDRNPIIAAPPEGLAVTGFRDPCVWREPDGWYLALGSGREGGHGLVLLYRSDDLLHWEYLHPLFEGESAATGRIFECPNFFSLDGQHVLVTAPIPLARGDLLYGGLPRPPLHALALGRGGRRRRAVRAPVHDRRPRAATADRLAVGRAPRGAVQGGGLVGRDVAAAGALAGR